MVRSINVKVFIGNQVFFLFVFCLRWTKSKTQIFCRLTQSRRFVFPLHSPFFHCWHLICIYIFLVLFTKANWTYFLTVALKKYGGFSFSFVEQIHVDHVPECRFIMHFGSKGLSSCFCLLVEGCIINHPKCIHILYFHCSMVPNSQTKGMNESLVSTSW